MIEKSAQTKISTKELSFRSKMHETSSCRFRSLYSVVLDGLLRRLLRQPLGGVGQIQYTSLENFAPFTSSTHRTFLASAHVRASKKGAGEWMRNEVRRCAQEQETEGFVNGEALDHDTEWSLLSGSATLFLSARA